MFKKQLLDTSYFSKGVLLFTKY